MELIMKKFCNVVFLALALLTHPVAAQTENSESPQPEKYQAIAKPEIAKFRFQPYVTQDKFGREIQFYLSKSKSEEALPLIVCIQGSGSQSIFQEVDTPEGKFIASGGPEAAIVSQLGDKVRVLVVEKPGVEFLVQPNQVGAAREASETYNQEFTLDRWVEAINAAVHATSELPQVDASNILALGHSEGGQVACQLAAVNPAITHVANMAGGGPNQLFDLIEQARSGDLYDPNATPEQRIQMLMTEWRKVQDDPLAHDKFILGHAHLRWSTFLSSSPIEAILQSKAKVFVASGTEDKNSLPASSDVFYAELLGRGRECVYERIEGANHGFMLPDDQDGKGWLETNRKAVEWYLNDIRK